MKKILFIDDDCNYQMVIKELLEAVGYGVTVANSAAEGLKLFKEKPFDLVLTDLMMPGIDGLQFLSLLRKINSRIKVVILTGSESDRDEIRSMQLMVNDYVKKPASFDVLLARIERVLTEDAKTEEATLISNNITVDTKRRLVFLDGQEVPLALKEYELLVYFMRNRNVVLSRQEILSEVWKQEEVFIDTRTIDSHIKKIRSKLHLLCIHSIRGVGYEWID